MKSMKKTIATLVAISMIFGCVIGGTIAWLMDTTDSVVNTFTTSDVGVTLTETNIDGNSATQNNYPMVPGHTIAKDPVVTVDADSEDCYIFVKLDKTGGVVDYTTYNEGGTASTAQTTWADFLSYEIADGWTLVTGQTDVYYRTVTNASASDAVRTFDVLKDDKVTVKTTVTKEMMNALETTTPDQKPVLTITAYAHQLYETNGHEFTAVEAWNNVSTATYNAAGANTTNGTV